MQGLGDEDADTVTCFHGPWAVSTVTSAVPTATLGSRGLGQTERKRGQEVGESVGGGGGRQAGPRGSQSLCVCPASCPLPPRIVDMWLLWDNRPSPAEPGDRDAPPSLASCLPLSRRDQRGALSPRGPRALSGEDVGLSVGGDTARVGRFLRSGAAGPGRVLVRQDLSAPCAVPPAPPAGAGGGQGCLLCPEAQSREDPVGGPGPVLRVRGTLSRPQPPA